MNEDTEDMTSKVKAKKSKKKKRHKDSVEEKDSDRDVVTESSDAGKRSASDVADGKDILKDREKEEEEGKDCVKDSVTAPCDGEKAAGEASDGVRDRTDTEPPAVSQSTEKEPAESCSKADSADSRGDASKEDCDGAQKDLPVKVKDVRDKIKCSKDTVDSAAKKAEDKIVRTGFWEKLRFVMTQPVPEEEAVSECRRMFREEMVRLRKEVEEFRELCLQQIKSQKQYVDEHRRACEKEIASLSQRNGISRRLSVVGEEGGLKEELKQMESSMEFFQQKQKLLDQEMELLNKEDELGKKHRQLEDYEKEIQEVESLLNQRQAICDRRQKHLLTLDEELHTLRQELEESKEQMQQEAGTKFESASDKAKKNCSPRVRSQEEWDIVRRNLLDKQHLLENTVHKYRSELAAASSNIAGKEILVAKLQQQVLESDKLVIDRERKIKQLENKLAFAVTEGRILEDQLHGVNRKNSINISPDELGRRGSLFHRQTSHDPGPRSPRSPLLKHQVNDLHGDDGKTMNGSATARPSSLSPQGSTVIRRRSMRSNSIAGDTLSRLTLRTPRDGDNDGGGSGACNVM